MRAFILAIFVIFVFDLQSQIITISDYSKLILNSDEYPNNLVKRLENEGFELMYESNALTTINLTYTLKKNDPYFYNIIIQRRGSIRNVVLGFNVNSAECIRLTTEIVKKMVKQPRSKNGDSRIIYYKDANNVYFGISVDNENNIDGISIANFKAYEEYYLKNGSDK